VLWPENFVSCFNCESLQVSSCEKEYVILQFEIFVDYIFRKLALFQNWKQLRYHGCRVSFSYFALTESFS
jgi:hypothetical protein